MKKCGKCGIEKDFEEFYFKSKSNNERRSKCKKCSIEESAKNKKIQKSNGYDYHKEYREKNKERLKKEGRERYKNETEKLKEKYKKFHLENPEKNKQYRDKYYSVEKNRIERNKKRIKKMNEDPNYKLSCNFRTKQYKAIKLGFKSGKTIDLLGCTFQEAKNHLESLFLPGMTWENWSKDGWHIDHIRPISSFDLTDPEQQKICFHYTNLQPLWAFDNLSKHNKY